MYVHEEPDGDVELADARYLELCMRCHCATKADEAGSCVSGGPSSGLTGKLREQEARPKHRLTPSSTYVADV